MAFHTTHPVSGKPLTIENPLTAKHIRIGALLWYWGFTSAGSWDCPAIITQISEKRRQFKVRSLDDMIEQDQWYRFGYNKNSDTTRQIMRTASAQEVKKYPDGRRIRLTENVEDAKSRVTRAETALIHFDQFVGSIIPTT